MEFAYNADTELCSVKRYEVMNENILNEGKTDRKHICIMLRLHKNVDISDRFSPGKRHALLSAERMGEVVHSAERTVEQPYMDFNDCQQVAAENFTKKVRAQFPICTMSSNVVRTKTRDKYINFNCHCWVQTI